MAGLSAFVFLEGLDKVTEARLDHRWLIWLLPVVSAFTGVVGSRWGGRSVEGTSLVVTTMRESGPPLPARLAPMVLIGSLLSHLVGASVGREGVGLQMSASITDALIDRVGIAAHDRVVLLRASVAGGFGAIFGVPWAGMIFGLELARSRRVRSIVPCGIAAFVGHVVVIALGHEHVRWPRSSRMTGPMDSARAVGLGVCLAIVVHGFKLLMRAVGSIGQRRARWWRAGVGGGAVLLMTWSAGRSYLGLSIDLAHASVAGIRPALRQAGWKLLFTVVSVGSGFPGGEVTPMFVIGSLAGAAVAPHLGMPVALGAIIGFGTVFGAAANVPFTCVVMSVELFGWGPILPVTVGCLVAWALSGPRSIYHR